MTLIDIRNIKGPDGFSLKGEIASRILDFCGITCNKNTIPGDTNAAHPGALRFGATWITQRGFEKKEVQRLAEIIHKVVSNLKPYKYKELSGDVGRAKIDQKLMDEAQKEVQELIMSLPGSKGSPLAEKSGYPHFHPLPGEEEKHRSPLITLHEEGGAHLETIHGMALPLFYKEKVEGNAWPGGPFIIDNADGGLIEVWGDRSRYFLEEIITGDLAALLPGRTMHTFMLHDDGSVMTDMTIARAHDDEQGFAHYIVLAGALNKETVLRRLRALSDGYVLFQKDDIYGKIQGPAVIDDLTCCEPSRQLTSIGIYGTGAEKVLQTLGCERVHRGIKSAQVGDIALQVVHSEIKGTSVGYELLVNPSLAASLWKKLDDAGRGEKMAKAGILLREKIRSTFGLPDYKKEGTLQETIDLHNNGFAEAFALDRPYFIGQHALLQKIKRAPKEKEFTFQEAEEAPLTTCLYEEHKKLTKKLVPFAGYTMPVWYTSINEEHRAVREKAGLFDVSHMGVLDFTGRDATRFLDLVATNYVVKLMAGQSQYSYLLDHRGDIIDDIMVYRRGMDHYMVSVNAADAKGVQAWITGVIAGHVVIDLENRNKELKLDVTMRDLKEESCGEARRVDVAIQGPRSIDILLKVLKDEKDKRKMRKLKRNEFFETLLLGKPAIISRTGYTGEEFGYELYIHPNDAVFLWNSLLEAGKEFGLIPTGLGSRDSTRTEAGLPLYGHELAGTFNITPHEAGYGSFVKFHKPYFIGRKPLIAREAKQDMEIVRFRMLAKGIRIVKTGDPLVTRKGDYIGAVTSCVTIDGVQWGLAYVKKRYAVPNTKVCVFVLPRDAKSAGEKPKDKLTHGDRIMLHEDALILTRFPGAGEEDVKVDRE